MPDQAATNLERMAIGDSMATLEIVSAEDRIIILHGTAKSSDEIDGILRGG